MTGVLQMTEEKGTIFNIQKFSITDGVGIRTLVFMKGCPLRCLWCSNPESQERRTEIMFVRTNCIGCGKCELHCPQEIPIRAKLKEADKALRPLPYKFGIDVARKFMLRNTGK